MGDEERERGGERERERERDHLCRAVYVRETVFLAMLGLRMRLHETKRICVYSCQKERECACILFVRVCVTE